MAAAPPAAHLGFSAVAIVNNAPLALSSVNLQFIFDPTTGVGEFSTLPVLAGGVPVLDVNGNPVLTPFTTAGPINVRVTVTDPGGLTLTNNFVINVMPANTGAPVANPDSYSAFKGVTMTALASGGVLANDSDPNLDPFTGSVVTGPAHGTLAFNADGSFTYLTRRSRNQKGCSIFGHLQSSRRVPWAAHCWSAMTIGSPACCPATTGWW